MLSINMPSINMPSINMPIINRPGMNMRRILGSMIYVSTICCPLHAHGFCGRLSHMVIRVGDGSSYSRWGKLTHLRALAVFRDYILRALAVFRGFVRRILPVLPSISGYDAEGTARARGSVLLILPVLAVFGPSVLLILQVLAIFRPPYSNTLSTRSTKCTRCSRVYSMYELYWECMCQVPIGVILR